MKKIMRNKLAAPDYFKGGGTKWNEMNEVKIYWMSFLSLRLADTGMLN